MCTGGGRRLMGDHEGGHMEDEVDESDGEDEYDDDEEEGSDLASPHHDQRRLTDSTCQGSQELEDALDTDQEILRVGKKAAG